MKYLFLILSIVLSVGVMGQDTAQWKKWVQVSGTWANTITGTYGLPTNLHYDTIPCIMLVSDTSLGKKNWGVTYDSMQFGMYSFNQKYQGLIFNQAVWQMRGYEVIEKSLSTISSNEGWEPVQKSEPYATSSIFMGWQRHSAYLDDKKQPLKLFVWLSKQIPIENK